MPRQALWGLNTSTWVTGIEHSVGTRPYVGISFQGGTAFLEFSGSGAFNTAHQSVRFRVSTTSMPSDSSTTSATAFNTNALLNYSTTTSSFNDFDTLYVKALFYTGSNGTGNYNSFSATLTKNGSNTNTGSLIWRPTYELYAWDGSAWRRFDTEPGLPDLISVQAFYVNPFYWQLQYSLEATAPTGFTLSVKQGFFEVGPFNVAGTSAGTLDIYTDATVMYTVQMQDASSLPYGTSYNVTPF